MLRPFEEYLKEYMGYLYGVVDKTYSYSQKYTGMLFELIDNWIDLVPREKSYFWEIVHSISGIILLNSWKLTNWISFEILCGKYFEALRNLRFIFEGSVYAVVVESLIESVVWGKQRSLSSLGLKAEIFRLWEICRSRKVYIKGRVEREKIRRIVEEFINNLPLSSKKRIEYIKLYTEILSQPELYMSIKSMIRKCCQLLEIMEEEKNLENLWHNLSCFQHFSYPYLEAVCEKPELVFLEVFDENILKLSLEYYFKTMDFFYAVIVWRFPRLRKNVEKICKWWKKRFNKSFTLAEKILDKSREGRLIA